MRFQFAGELNDFLAPDKRNKAFQLVAGTTDTLKHVIESIGIPHTEIGRVVVNGQLRGLSAALAEGDEVSVFPHAVPLTFAKPPRFVVDGHLGRLAAYLRMLGFDTWYERLADDERLASVSNREQRILLTRDVGLLKRRDVIRAAGVTPAD